MSDSIDSLIEEAQKYIIGITSSQEDFITPKYTPYYPEINTIPSSASNYVTNISSKKEHTKTIDVSVFSKEADALDIENIRSNIKLTKPNDKPYPDPPKQALFLKVPNTFDRSEIDEVLNKESKQTDVPARKIDNISNNRLDNDTNTVKSSAELLDSLYNDNDEKVQDTVPEKKLKDLRILPKDKFEVKTTQGYYDENNNAGHVRDDLSASLSLGLQQSQELSNKNIQARMTSSDEDDPNKSASNENKNSIWSIIENGEIKSSYQKDITFDKQSLKNIASPDDNDATMTLQTNGNGIRIPRYKTIVQNNPISGLLSTGADAMQNAFDVFFYYPTAGNESTQIGSFKDRSYAEDESLSNTLDPNSPLLKLVAKITGLSDDGEDSESIIRYFKNLMMPSVFGARVQSITIPQVNISTNSVNFLNKSISKQGSPNLEQKLSFSIRTDQNLYIIDSFNYMAGQSALLSGFLDEKNLHEKVKALRSIPNVWSKMRPLQGGYRLSDPGLCLIVKLRNLGQKNIDNIISMTNSQKTISDYTIADNLMPYYVFENIKILGSDDAINFSNGSPSMGQTMNIQFIYRRLVKVIITEDQEEIDSMSINKIRNSSTVWY